MAEVPRAGVEETDAAVARAKEAFPAWRAVAPADRAALLHRLADALAERAPRTWRRSRRATPASRSPTRAARWGWWSRPSATTPAPRSGCSGQTIPVAGGVDMTFREPLGVVGLIVPWNFPLLIASWKVAPALAAGNTVVLKPAELTPLTALELERIALEAGLPEGVLNVVAGPGSVCGRRLVEHPRRGQDRLHGLDRGRAAGSRRAPRRRSSASPWSWAASRPTSCSPTPTSSGRPRRRRWPCSATPARTAARARGSWSRGRPSTASWRRSRTADRSRCGSAIRSTRRPRWAR